MIKLKQTNSQKLVTFLYGTCADECIEFDLVQHSDFFDAIYEFTQNGLSRWYKPSGASYFTKLKCGQMYLAILNAGESSLEIEQATLSYFETENSNLRITSQEECVITTPIPTTNKKILMLHGGGESSTSFQNQQGVIDLRNALSDYEFIFADAPTNNLWIQDPPGGKDNPTQDFDWADESILYLDNFISQHGPFDCILGYSQGAAFIPVYLSNTKNNFDKVVMCNGYLPYTHQGLMETINSNTPFNTASLVFSGENDFGFKEMADDLASKFSNCQNIKSTVAGHHLPYNNDNTFNQIVDFIA